MGLGDLAKFDVTTVLPLPFQAKPALRNQAVVVQEELHESVAWLHTDGDGARAAHGVEGSPALEPAGDVLLELRELLQ